MKFEPCWLSQQGIISLALEHLPIFSSNAEASNELNRRKYFSGNSRWKTHDQHLLLEPRQCQRDQAQDYVIRLEVLLKRSVTVNLLMVCVLYTLWSLIDWTELKEWLELEPSTYHFKSRYLGLITRSNRDHDVDRGPVEADTPHSCSPLFVLLQVLFQH